jgi:lysophospholipase L1-like esterase
MDTKKLMIYGDSVLKGVIYDTNNHKYVVSKKGVGSLLKEKINLNIINKSILGNTVTRATKRFKKDLDMYDPDIVLIELGGNDCDYKWEEIKTNPLGEHFCNTDYQRYEEQLESMVDEVVERGDKPILSTLAPIDADKYFKWFCHGDSSMESEILKFLGNVTKIYWWQERYNSAALRVAIKKQCPVLDIRGAFLKTPDYREYFCVDGIHPNEQGHALMTDYVVNYIEENARYLLA